MSLIQRFPGALLALLSIKASDTPQQFGNVTAPSLEMLPFYISDRVEGVSTSQTLVTDPTTLKLTVPQGEYWVVLGASINATAISAPGANVQLSVGIQDPASSGPVYGAMFAPTVSIATQSISCPAALPGPLVLRPGCSVIGNLDVDPGAQTMTLVLRALIARLSATS